MTLADWTPLTFEPAPVLEGTATRLERLSGDHADALDAANRADDAMWAYLPYGPFADREAYRDWVAEAAASSDPIFYAIRGEDGWAGVASYLRVDRANGVIEIGHIAMSAALQRTRAATEAIHLMIAQAFAAGFRRVEWKCDAANGPSLAAARRYGFGYDGTFRQHMVVKGRNRDTAWFAILDGDWPRLCKVHRAWLDADNFDAAGRQARSLSVMVAEAAGATVA
ncbi:GNAT family protein [uncultured Jannaschia sp.]|uniref:GNAT family N-acetyltransferase n=1 Tax=uncultured Jannaschia sp. TaxID=293347 RepID=UPI0026048F3A|nr:GNAT family protein [uncultured Jannaschia sp.]